MRVITARNVNGAFYDGLNLIKNSGIAEDSRAGRVLVMPYPVVTLYQNPWERVLFYTDRDANPFFHLMEAIWMLAGSNDARWLDQFVRDFSSRFAEADGHQHGAYGYRWRQHFDVEGGGNPRMPNQLSMIVKLLKENPKDRRIVLTMWDPVADLGANYKDVPCNTHIYFRVRDVHYERGMEDDKVGPVLDMTVCCRSNDAIWGAYGANAVHFSFLQEYMAARIDVGVGCYYQISNNFHAYQAQLDRFPLTVQPDAYAFGTVTPIPLYDAAGDLIDLDVIKFVGTSWDDCTTYHTRFFRDVAWPMRKVNEARRAKDMVSALGYLAQMPGNNDWRLAAKEWIERRMVRQGVKT